MDFGRIPAAGTAHAIAVAKLKGIVAAIDGALQSHLGKRDKASARARAQAERLAALAKLL